MKLGRSLLRLTALVAAAMILAPGQSIAQEEEGEMPFEVITEKLRTYPLPAVFQLEGATVDTGIDGITLLLAPYDRGSPEVAPRCLVVVADAERARSYDYDYRFDSTTGCVDATAHPDGGFFVRGEVGADPDEVGQGFTARIDADGEVLWTVDDEDLVAHEDFVGSYAGVLAGLAYDTGRDHLLAMTLGVTPLLGTERLVEQAHILNGSTGNLVRVGQAFGPLARDRVLDVIGRDGEFLVVTESDDRQERRFFSYEVGRAMSQFEPESANWSDREIVPPVVYRPELGTLYLWEDDADRWGVIRTEGLDSVVWSEGVDFAVGAQRVWAGDQIVAVLFRGLDLTRFVVFVDAATGLPMATEIWSDLVDADPLELVTGPDGDLRLLAVEPGGELGEYTLELVVAADEDDENGENGDPTTTADEDGRCQSVGGGPGAPLWLLMGLGLLAVGRGRRPNPRLRDPGLPG